MGNPEKQATLPSQDNQNQHNMCWTPLIKGTMHKQAQKKNINKT